MKVYDIEKKRKNFKLKSDYDESSNSQSMNEENCMFLRNLTEI